MSGMDPHMVRDFAQEMSRALATAEARISHLEDQIQRVRDYHEAIDVHYPHLVCRDCQTQHPCPTIKALNGEN